MSCFAVVVGKVLVSDLLSIASVGSSIECVLSLTSGVGTNRVRRGPLGSGMLTVVFRGSSAEAEISFSIKVCRLNKETVFLSSGSLRVNEKRPVSSATGILDHFISKVVVHTVRRSSMVRLTGRSSMPIVDKLAGLRRPYRTLTSVLAVGRRLNS